MRGALRAKSIWLRLRHPRVLTAGRSSIIDNPRRVWTQAPGRVVLGQGVRVLRDSELLGPMVIGDNTFINRGVYIRAGVEIGREVAIGPFVRLITDSHQLAGPFRRAGDPTCQPIIVGDGVWIGACVTVLPGVTIGDGAVIAAGSVVSADVAPHTLVAGIPASPKRDLGNTDATAARATGRE